MVTPPAPPLLTSAKPYLLRAWHEWMMDNGLTPYLLVKVDGSVSVPREYVKNDEVVLNISTEATGGLSLGNDEIRFQARFSGRVRDILVPMDRVASIFARENGQGMTFDLLQHAEDELAPTSDDAFKDGKSPAGLTLVNKDESADIGGREGGDESAAKDDQPPPQPPSGGGKSAGLRVVK